MSRKLSTIGVGTLENVTAPKALPKEVFSVGELSIKERTDLLFQALGHVNIEATRTNGKDWPKGVFLHDRAATVPSIVVSPKSEEDVVHTLQLIKTLDIHEILPVSIKSGGHGYFNGATCSGMMINLLGLDRKTIDGDVLTVEPGCILGQIVPLLAQHHKAVPHGDCFGVGAGGHFTTAGYV